MPVQENIRRLDSQGGAPGREIARRLGVSRSSVTKYIDQENYSPEPPAPPARHGASVLTGFEHIIETWLGEDQRRNRKQRHTAQRIFDRLVDEHGHSTGGAPEGRCW
ncbi:UNVERIFIED_ORG: transposase [Arthrobacter sp. UYEF13]